MPGEIDWIDDLALACQELRAFVDGGDSRLLGHSVRRMGRLLGKKPDVINIALLNVARQLLGPLDRLQKALQAVCTFLQLSNVVSSQAAEMDAASRALIDLHGRLQQLVGDHDTWQGLDRECRRMAGELNGGLDEFEFSWPDLMRSVLDLCATDTDWAAELRDWAERVATAAAAAEAAGVVAPFRCFWRAVSRHFFAVDEELRAMCSQLEALDGPLAALLTVLDWSVVGEHP